MGWSGSCRRGSGAGSLEFDIWSCNSRPGDLEGGWRPMETVAVVLQPSGLRHPSRRLQGRLAASLAAAGVSGGKLGRCRAAAMPLHLPPF